MSLAPPPWSAWGLARLTKGMSDMTAARPPQRPRARRRLAIVAALAAGLAIAPAASAADGLLVASSPPQVTPVANAQGGTAAVLCTPGGWLQIPAAKPVFPQISYSWLANGLTVGGASSNVYPVTASDTGKALTCVTTAVLVVGSAGQVTTYRGSAISPPLVVTQPAPTAPTTRTRNVGVATLVMPRASTRSVNRSGRVPIASRVTCSARCRIAVSWALRVGRTTFSSVLRRRVEGAAQTLTVVLPRAARRALNRVDRGRLRVVITVRAGGRTSTLRQTLTLREA